LDPLWQPYSGFLEAEVQSLLKQLAAKIPDETDPKKKLIENALPRLREAYGGYDIERSIWPCPKMYNADMVLYFLRYVVDKSIYPDGDALIDNHTSISNLLGLINSLPHPFPDPSLGWLLKLPLKGIPISGSRDPRTVNMAKILNLYQKNLRQIDARERLADFFSTCYYYGALTTQKISKLENGKTHHYHVGIPNQVMRHQLLTQLNEPTDDEPDIRQIIIK